MSIKPMTVANMAFMLENQARECPAKQFIRELAENSIQSLVNIPDGRIEWDYDRKHYKKTGYKKLNIVDNGCGMTPQEMMQHINHFASSGKTLGFNDNFGAGAKLTAGVQSPKGVVYKSWKNGQGAMVVLCKEDGQYGLKELRPDEHGDNKYWKPLRFFDKPKIIKDHGTQVTLLGKNEKHETFFGMETDKQESGNWIFQYLNTRYNKIPDNIDLVVFGSHKDEKLAKKEIRKVSGQEKLLNQYAEKFGTVTLTDAKIKWWLKPENTADVRVGRRFDFAHQIAVISNDEIYNKSRLAAAERKLADYGITIGSHRVILYIQPKANLPIKPNMVRGTLRFGQKPLDIRRWADEFRNNMPKTLNDYINGLLKNSENDNEKSVQDSISKYLTLFNTKAYKSPKQDDLNAKRIRKRKRKEKNNKKNVRDGKNHADVYYAGKNKEETTPTNRQIKPDTKGRFNAISNKQKKNVRIMDYPNRVVWVSLKNKNRDENDATEDRAGSYISGDQNMVFINEDFREYQKFRDTVLEEYESITRARPEAKTKIVSIINKFWERNLVEAVIQTKSFIATSGKNAWSEKQKNDMLSPEGLTMSIMSQIPTFEEIKREINKTFRKARRKKRNNIENQNGLHHS